MTESNLLSRQRDALRLLHETLQNRAVAEPATAQGFESRRVALERAFENAMRSVIDRFEQEKDVAQKDFEEKHARITARGKAECEAQDAELNETRRRVTLAYESGSQKAKTTYQDARWTASSVFEAEKSKAETQYTQHREQLAAGIEKAKALHQEGCELLQSWRVFSQLDKPSPTAAPDRKFRDAVRQLQDCLETEAAHFESLGQLKLPRFFGGARVVLTLLGVWTAVVGVAGLATATDWEGWLLALGLGTLAVLGLGGAIVFWLYLVARRQAGAAYQKLYQAFADAEAAWQRAREQTRDTYQMELGNSKKRFDREMKQSGHRYKQQRLTLKTHRDAELRQAQQRFDQLRAETVQQRDGDLQDNHARYQRLWAEIFARYESDSQRLREQHSEAMQANRTRRDTEFQALADAWHNGLSRVHDEFRGVSGTCAELFPIWHDPSWSNWKPRAALPPVIRFGEYTVQRDKLQDGIPADERLHHAPATFTAPALLNFPRGCSLLLHASEADREGAARVLQTVMLRMLTAIPPGKVRFTILDPVGRGENFAAFMHLADHDEQLVTNRIWTELPHIEQRLADLTAHMENVIQKYLRNQYPTIEDYNNEAGEVAEPFRILVVANFPVNFSTDAARRLISIASSGARCGVYTLIGVDPKQPLPQGIDLNDLKASCVNLTWEKGRCTWANADFGPYPLTLDAMPDNDFSTRILQQVGRKAKEASRVEVPFEFITAPQEQWWRSDSRSGVAVPLGRAGATKRQLLQLGRGTSQHVVVAGKTGSGKSTLLHALITNAALLYSPEEIEFYLVDFKKGVEFKTYATHELPHARVVAIESEREFGLSVLQRLDAELKVRGEKFREVNAQDVAAYRAARPDAVLPRILLIVDEFQEFFVEDDRLAQDAAQLFDRLVRQGRAFGLHVLLGSQTLGGAYSLARSTIDQMAVRIALQCSENDAHLILSDDNSAARLLSRPGEAIYNDANGLVEGNNPFQVVWLPEPSREKYIGHVRALDAAARATKGDPLPRPQIVFEGNAPADLSRNPLLARLLHAPRRPENLKAYHAWLGDAIAIKDPTAAVFRPQTGSNLLIVGQQEEAALGIVTAMLLSLAAQYAPDQARFLVIDASPSDAPHAGFLAGLAEVVPHTLRVAGPRDVPAAIGELAELVTQRQQAPDRVTPTHYLFVYGLHRVRDLRRAEDDYSFGSSTEALTPPQQLSNILREGSALGVHAIFWADTLTNVTRCLDRQALREIEMRVLFQMSASDSSTLIDNPAASKVGPHRALFHSEEQGRMEKFRPYGLPPAEWLADLRHRLHLG